MLKFLIKWNGQNNQKKGVSLSVFIKKRKDTLFEKLVFSKA